MNYITAKIQITESDLKNIIRESIDNFLNEGVEEIGTGALRTAFKNKRTDNSSTRQRSSISTHYLQQRLGQFIGKELIYDKNKTTTISSFRFKYGYVHSLLVGIEGNNNAFRILYLDGRITTDLPGPYDRKTAVILSKMMNIFKGILQEYYVNNDEISDELKRIPNITPHTFQID